MNLFQVLKDSYGKPVIKKLRRWESTSKKLAKTKNALIFSLRCKDSQVIPVYLRIKTTVRGKNAQNIIKNTQKQLLRESIRLLNSKIKRLKQELQVAEDEFIRSIRESHRREHEPRECPVANTNRTDLDRVIECAEIT